LSTYLWVAIGGALGSVARFALSSSIAVRIGDIFPWGTLIVNVSGCLAIGIFAALTGPDGRILVAPDIRVFVTVGLCGGYTTFSSFGIQTLSLAQAGDWPRAGGNIALSIVTCLAAVWLGYVAGSALNQYKGG
jgi:CrcB protein